METGCINEGKAPIRVAHIIGKLNAAGVEAVMNNYYRCIDRDKYQFDFIIDSDGSGHPRPELVELGARYFTVPPYQKLFRHFAALRKLFLTNRYLIVHASMNSLSLISLCAAWSAGVPVRINHSHNTAAPGEFGRTLLKNVLRCFSRVFATHCCACSRIAGEWLFGRKAVRSGAVQILRNAIDTKKFGFDQTVRDTIRERYGLQNNYVIGHVGRFCYQKNQEFALEVLSALCREDPDVRLLMIGTGTTEEKLKKKAEQFGVCEAVLFLGACDDVSELYQAMDLFVFPSRYEGLGLVAVEAQCAGLPVIASTEVPDESKVTDRIRYLPLSDGAEAWAKEILHERTLRRDRHVSIDPRYDIQTEAKVLEAFYDRAVSELGGR